ncbi:calponin homology domain-containing protein DDB_G0272472-like [Penaeus indicus]|uniref:calponin homology domain-containing protein DDB_G0272472-like n=1 Tax=Penaeus indicus TaxID=29960 RepID=UPI00300C65AB
MEDLLSCMVCCEPYQEKMRHPVLLPRCGHSFCRPCIAFMVKGGNVVCPSCRMDQRVETADDLPTEFSLLAITAAQQVAKLETCQVHDVKLSFWCKSCKMATCGECLFEDHPTHSHDVIKATRYIIEMKDAINDLANKFMETLDIRERRLYDMVYKSAKGINDALRTICVLRKDMEEARDLMKGVKKVDGIAPTTRLSEAAKFLGLKWNLHDAKLGLVPASLKKDQAKAQGEKKEAELQKEAEEKKQDSPEEKEEDKEKEDNAKEDKEKESDDKTKQTKDGENKEDDDEDEESTDESEEEVLTEEELKKRQKILKVKERIAAAAAAAAAEKELKEKKMMEKERKAVKEKNNNASTEPEQVPSPKLLKPWKKRSVVAPVSREPSITPERELEKKERSEKIESPTEKEDANKQNDKDKENAENEDKEKKEETEAKAENGEPNNEKDNKETKETENNAPAKKDASQESAANDPPKAATEPSNASPPKDKEKAKEETEAKEAKREAETKKEAKKTPSTAKRPRGRLARQALKRAQTMDLSKRVQADGDKEEGEAESQNIKGLDLETGKSNKPEEAENKENEAGATGETKEEAKDDKNEEEKKEEKTEEEKKKEDETRGATAVKEDEEDTMFELDPDEKDRIATELMMVPSLTVCVEGRGGLMARVQWEPQGLHVYSHQAQDLPYDVLIKVRDIHGVREGWSLYCFG